MTQALDDHASRTQTLVRTTLLLAVAVLMLYPLLWLVGASFKSNAQIFSEVGFWPERFDFGAYANSITGPGDVNVVPEPGTYGLMALGLAVVGFAARRSRR